MPREVDWFSLISVLGLLCFAPFIVFYFVMACDQYQCSLSQPLLELLHGETTLLSIWERTASFSWSAAKIYSVWVAFQVKLDAGGGFSGEQQEVAAHMSLQVFLYMCIPDITHKMIPGYVGGVQDGARTPAGNEDLNQDLI